MRTNTIKQMRPKLWRKTMALAVIIIAALGLITTALAATPRSTAQINDNGYAAVSPRSQSPNAVQLWREGDTLMTRFDIYMAGSSDLSINVLLLVGRPSELNLGNEAAAQSGAVSRLYGRVFGEMCWDTWASFFRATMDWNSTGFAPPGSSITTTHMNIPINPNVQYYTVALFTGTRVFYNYIRFDPSVPLPPDPVRPGFNFVGWYFDAAFTQPYDGRPIFQDTVLHARFTAITFTITYNLNGGTNHASNPATFTVESGVITLAAPTRDGFTFAGWSDGGTIPAGSIGNRTFTAQWTAIVFSITYNLNGGHLAVRQYYFTIESPTIVIPEPTRAGFTFAGWVEGNSIPAGSTGNRTFTAQWTAIVFNITYNLNGGYLAVRQDYFTVESPIIVLAEPTRDGHNFRGWFADANFTGSPVTQIAQGTIGDVTLFARWEIQRFTVTFMVGDTVHSTITVDWGTTFNTTVFLVDMQSFTAVELFMDSALSHIFNNPVQEDITLHTVTPFAIFNSITFNVNGALHTDLRAHNDTLNNLFEPVAPVGFEFAGWYYNNNFTRPVLASDRLTTNVTLYARFVAASDTSDIQGNWFTDNWLILVIIGGGALLLIGGITYGVKKKKKG